MRENIIYSKDVSSDGTMLENTKKVIDILEKLKEEPLTDAHIEKVLKVQDLIKEVNA